MVIVTILWMNHASLPQYTPLPLVVMKILRLLAIDSTYLELGSDSKLALTLDELGPETFVDFVDLVFLVDIVKL